MTTSIRGITPEEFFPCENNIDPPSIAFASQMRKDTKSDLLPCLESVTLKSKCAEIPSTVTAHTVPEWAERLKNCSVSESGFVLKSTLLGSRISGSRQNLMRAFRENHKKVDF